MQLSLFITWLFWTVVMSLSVLQAFLSFEIPFIRSSFSSFPSALIYIQSNPVVTASAMRQLVYSVRSSVVQINTSY